MKFVELTGKHIKLENEETTIAINPLKVQYIDRFCGLTIVVWNENDWFYTTTDFETVKKLLEGAEE